MKIFALAVAFVAAAEDNYYNILAMDGGGIRGIIPAVILQKMEKVAYKYANDSGYTGFPQYEGREGIIAMKDLFNMTAGTSTGSILAAGLVYPNKDRMEQKEPKFFADDLLKIYSERGGEIFVKVKLGGFKSFLYLLLHLIIFGAIGYFIGV